MPSVFYSQTGHGGWDYVGEANDDDDAKALVIGQFDPQVLPSSPNRLNAGFISPPNEAWSAYLVTNTESYNPTLKPESEQPKARSDADDDTGLKGP